jgi:class 3 adenylate cyclase
MAVLFTDIVGSTDLNERLGDEMMARIRKRHFDRGDRCLKINRGRRVKTIGDSIMAVFPTPSDALDFAIMFRADTGDENVRVRAGFHVGPVLIEGGDTFGSTVNYAARVTSQAQGPDIIVSNEAYKQIKSHKSQAHASIQWLKHSAMKLKGFKGKRLLWSIRDEEAAIPRKPSKRV